MQSIVTKNEQGEITKRVTGQDKVQEETAKFWEKMFADEGIETTEDDIKNYLGEEASKGSRKVTDREREEMDLEITLEDIKDTVKNPAYGRQRISRPMRIVAPLPQLGGPRIPGKPFFF